jgi:hypothetical protein
MILTGENQRTRRKTCPSATLSTTNPTWIDPGANPGLQGERPATNDLSHGTAIWYAICSLNLIYRTITTARLQIWCSEYNVKLDSDLIMLNSHN